jgi:hypothetical protein
MRVIFDEIISGIFVIVVGVATGVVDGVGHQRALAAGGWLTDGSRLC